MTKRFSMYLIKSNYVIDRNDLITSFFFILFSIFSTFITAQDKLVIHSCNYLQIDYSENGVENFSILENEIQKGIWTKTELVYSTNSRSQLIEIKEPGNYRVTSFRGYQNKNVLISSLNREEDQFANTFITNEVLIEAMPKGCVSSNINTIEISVFPNPVTSEVTVKVDGINLNDLESQMIKVININGQVVIESKFSNTIDVSYLKEGIYCVVLNYQQYVYTQEFVKSQNF